MTTYKRQAVVIVHGMGEQLPLSTLTGFIDTALAPTELPDGTMGRVYYSRPESVTGSFESRRFLAPRAFKDGVEQHAQTDFYEYHWADKMAGNRIDDLWPTFRRILWQPITRVPRGLKAIWVLSWLLIALAAWSFIWGPWRDVLGQGGLGIGKLVGALISGGLTAAAISYVLARVLPKWLSASFVDVVRYLDTSPRSYAVRRDIRKGLVEMLQGLHSSRQPRYDRIVIVAHSLGAFIAYDAISYLWGLTNAKTGPKAPASNLGGLRALEVAASALPNPEESPAPDESSVASFQAAQRVLWQGQRAQGNPWLISDFVSVGTPMYFADQLMHGTGERDFWRRIERRELPTCPPQNEESESNNIHHQKRFYSWPKGPRRVLYEGAPFAVVRWTNLFFPTTKGVFGDWFGGPLAPLFGYGVRDLAILGNTVGRPGTSLIRNRKVPALAHTLYFKFAQDDAPDSAATLIRSALDLASTEWLNQAVPDEPDPLP